MLINGGFNSETQKTLSDFHLLDLERAKWMGVEVDSQMSEHNSVHIPLHELQYHTITAVYSQSNYNRSYEGNQRDQKRMMWFTPHTAVDYEQGFYVFGGVDS
jgi:hypothetical protein